MKTDERHQIEQNELADWLSDFGPKLKPYLPHFVAVCLAAFVVGWFIHQRSTSAFERQANAWRYFFDVDGAERADDRLSRLDTVLNDFGDLSVAPIAKMRRGDLLFQRGKEMLTSDRAAAIKKLEDAETAYKEVADASNAPTSLIRQAMLAQAMCMESRGATAKARDAYKAVSERFPGTPEALLAGKRSTKMDTPEVKAFYEKLAGYERPKLDLEPLTPKKGSKATGTEKSDGASGLQLDFKDIVAPPPPPPPPPASKTESTPKTATEKPATKPTEAPAAKPAEKPAEKPTAKPEEKPQAKPAEKTPEKSAAK